MVLMRIILDFEEIYEWVYRWQIKFIAGNCELLCFGRKIKKRQREDAILQVAGELTYPAVQMHNSLKMIGQIQNVFETVSGSFDFINRGVENKSRGEY